MWNLMCRSTTFGLKLEFVVHTLHVMMIKIDIIIFILYGGSETRSGKKYKYKRCDGEESVKSHKWLMIAWIVWFINICLHWVVNLKSSSRVDWLWWWLLTRLESNDALGRHRHLSRVYDSKFQYHQCCIAIVELRLFNLSTEQQFTVFLHDIIVIKLIDGCFAEVKMIKLLSSSRDYVPMCGCKKLGKYFAIPKSILLNSTDFQFSYTNLLEKFSVNRWKGLVCHSFCLINNY